MCWPKTIRSLALIALTSIACEVVLADPCGMVPPIYDGPGTPITRVGEQKTYVFFKDGVESFVIHPGFSGKVDQFGMLIPFPTPPAIRKIPDHIFPHIAAGVDPPEVVIDLAPLVGERAAGASPSGSLRFRRSKSGIKVLREEAVGMYEVAVLEAGSPAALKRWMDDHGFRYPDGMDRVTVDYVEMGWCFVAVKTKVGKKDGVNPKPGQRRVESKLPAGSNFDGRVQAMGFRFKTAELVVPMRLSAFNAGKTRNIVYLMTDGPKKIRSIPEEYVMRQIPGTQLFKNLTEPLPLRIIGGTRAELQAWHLKGLKQRRDPNSKNGAAKELFASDLMAIRSGKLSLPQEEQEKELLRIGEQLSLRGPEVDKLNLQALQAKTDKAVKAALKDINKMTLTVVDGDFPREVLAKQNLTFAEYRMPKQRNTPRSYDAILKGPVPKKRGAVILGHFDGTMNKATTVSTRLPAAHWAILLSTLLVGVALVLNRRRAS